MACLPYFLAYICFLDLTSWSFFVTVSKVEEELDEGVQSETEGSENISFLGQDQIKEDKNAADSLQFEELTEEVKLALQQIFFPILVAYPLNLSSKCLFVFVLCFSVCTLCISSFLSHKIVQTKRMKFIVQGLP